jgi:methyl-accepting chemotaxis protein
VNRNVQGLNDLASENTHVIERLNSGGTELGEVAKRLREHTRRFRL